MKIKKQLNNLFKVIVEEAKVNPQFEKRLEDILFKEVQSKTTSKRTTKKTLSGRSTMRSNKRASAIFDPFDVFQEGVEPLKEKLYKLDIEKLKDIIAEFGMDPAKLAMNWKTAERLIQHILTTVESRSKKGDAFRGEKNIVQQISKGPSNK